MARSSSGSPVMVGASSPVFEWVLETVSAIPNVINPQSSVTIATG
jgi:hypothetical protein